MKVARAMVTLRYNFSLNPLYYDCVVMTMKVLSIVLALYEVVTLTKTKVIFGYDADITSVKAINSKANKMISFDLQSNFTRHIPCRMKCMMDLEKQVNVTMMCQNL